MNGKVIAGLVVGGAVGYFVGRSVLRSPTGVLVATGVGGGLGYVVGKRA